MPIKGIHWPGTMNRDIHVLRGQSTRDLTLTLRVTKDDDDVVTADKYLVTEADITLTFTPLFKGTVSGLDFVGDNNGISVSTMLGVVTVDPGMPANRKNNFIVEVEAKNDGDGKVFRETIRFQVHGSVRKVWLTPDRLTVRPKTLPPEPTNYRFTVRAEFDDGVVGDLTVGHGVTWSPSSHVTDEGALVVDSGDHAGDNIFISAKLPDSLGGATTDPGPTMTIGRAWTDEPSPPKAHVVPGGGYPTDAVPPDNVPNVLFLGDGWRDLDEPSFDQMVNTFVHHLKTDQLSNPFNLLSRSMNYWKVFLPAAQAGISFRGEMYRFGISFARAMPVAKNEPPKDPGDPWSLAYVLYRVGLPIPGDDDDSRTPDVLREEWKKLVTPDPTDHVSDKVVREWKKLARRTFIEEQDGFPGMCYGTPPAANETDNYKLDLHPDRASVDDLKAFHATISSDDAKLTGDKPVGLLWAKRTFRFDNTDLVVLVSSFPGGRALNGTGYIALSTKAGNAYVPVTKLPDRNALTLDAFTIPEVDGDRCRTTAHEIAHSFGINDEYADFHKRYPDDEPKEANVQTEADLLITDPHDATKKVISSLEIKWNWPRIAAAAVVRSLITPKPGGQFRIPVSPDISFRFVKDDIVFLRRRRWGQIPKKQKSMTYSPRLIVAADPSEAGAVIVKPATGTIAIDDMIKFSEGSLFFKARLAPASVRTADYPFAEMVAKNVRDAIEINRKPLTVVPCDLEDGDDEQIPILDAGDSDDPRTPVAGMPKHVPDMPWVVGLYAGGVLYSCGIFHPAGQCMMRKDHDSHAQFCAVCRFILVDMIDPAFHSDIDDAYDKTYPQK